MPLILEPLIDKTESVAPGVNLYRGSSNRTALLGKLSPRNPIQTNFDSPFEIADLIFNQQKAQKHILELEKYGHFVSFALRKNVACFYATSKKTQSSYVPYIRCGYIAIVKFPKLLEPPITIGGEGPYIFKCANGTVWLDLRHLPPSSIKAASRTRVDHEILLIEGSVQIPNPVPVRPEQCDRSFLPWKDYGEQIKIS